MKKYKKKFAPCKQGVYLKQRIAKTHGRVKFVGIMYLLATLAVSVLACLPLLKTNAGLAVLGAADFWKVFQNLSENAFDTAAERVLIFNSVLYGIMLFGLLINVLRSFSKLKWLFKKKGSKTYNFNRNAYAMEDLGKLFSGSFALILIIHTIVYVVCGTMDVQIMLYVLLGVALFVHFFCGLIGAKTSYFDTDQYGGLYEKRRAVGRIAPFIRNVLQLVATFAMLYFYLGVNNIHTLIEPLMQENAWANFIEPNLTAFAAVALQILTLLWLMVLLKHATATTEFSPEGTEAMGMKNFRIFSFFTLLTAGGAFVCRYMFGEAFFEKIVVYPVLVIEKSLQYDLLILAGIAFVMFVIEVVMRKMPAIPEETEVSVQQNPFEKPDEAELRADLEKELEGAITYTDAVQVDCPTCGRKLKVRAALQYHRCPACGKVLHISIK